MYANTLACTMIDLKTEMSKYDEEIRYLENLLVSTSGPRDDVIVDLKMARQELKILDEKFAAAHTELQKLQENFRKM